MRIEIDPDLCISAGNCEADMPDVFEVQREGPTKVVAQPDDDQRRDAEWVAQNCPTGAIRIVES